MAYQALYRKYRPVGFEELIGQDHVKQTILNTLRSNRFSHAYLFSGPRGTGKTSIAKLIAKAINCLDLQNGEPCNQCSNCTAANNNAMTDIYEMDAASNNGVEEIRSIRDDVQFAPTEGKYKVYIIDEVHMLSVGAFNALLKTLEEPPKHVIFILATTEPQKIPMTIISRCQRFDFKRISPKAMIERMKFIANEQNLPIEDEAFRLIAQIAQGGMRDALSLLDQTIAFSDGKVSAEHVTSVVGKVSITEIAKLIASIHEGDIPNVLGMVEEMIEAGKEPELFLDDLMGYYRDLLLYQLSKDETQLNTAIVGDTFLSLAHHLDVNMIQKVIHLLMEQKSLMKWSNSVKTALEVAMVKLTTLNENKVDKPSQLSQKTTTEVDPNLAATIQELKNEVAQLKKQTISTEETKQENEHKQNQIQKEVYTQEESIPVTNVRNQAVQQKIKKEILPVASKKCKVYLENLWQEILVSVLSKSRNSFQLFNQGTICLASKDHAVISFPIVELVKGVSHEDIALLKEVVTQTIQVPLDFVIIIENEWKNIQMEYINEIRNQKSKQ